MNRKKSLIAVLLLCVIGLAGCSTSALLPVTTEGAESWTSPADDTTASEQNGNGTSEDVFLAADVDRNGFCNISDVSYLLDLLARSATEEVMDVNGDGAGDIQDVTVLLDLLSGISETGGEILFRKNEEEGYLTVVGVAEPVPKKLVIPASNQGLPVKKIEDYAFYGKSAIEEIVLLAQIEEIGGYAFNGCYNVTALTLSEGLKVIGTSAFSGCSALKAVKLPASVEKLGVSAFADCSALEKVECAQGNEAYYAVSDCLIEKESKALMLGCKNSVPEGLEITAIAETAFAGSTGLKEITIPSEVTDIGVGAFRGCSNLEKVEIRGAVETIPAQTFQGCTSLKTVILPEELTTVGAFAFSHCTALAELNLPASVSNLGRYAFEYSGLTKTNLPAGISEVAEGLYRYCRKLTEITIPEGVTAIGSKAFNECDAVKKISLPSTLKNILAVDAFIGCNPDSITVAKGNSVYKVSGNCLIHISKKTLVKAGNGCTVPSDGSVTVIESYAFAGCSGIPRLVLPAQLKEFGSNSFANCKDLKVLVYLGSKEEWAGLMRGFNWNEGSDFVMEFGK